MTKLVETESHLSTQKLDKYHVTVLSNFACAYDKYAGTYSKAALPARFPNQFFLLDMDTLSVGIQKAQAVLAKNKNPHDEIIVLKTCIAEPLFNDHETGIGHYVKRNFIKLDACYLWQNETLLAMSIEELMAKSLALNDLLPYQQLKPRSISVLPIAQGCQASCSFCFSKASVSKELNGFHKHLDRIDDTLSLAKHYGAERAVITGGGEPTLLRQSQLVDVVARMKKHFDKVVLISNAYVFSQASASDRCEFLNQLSEAGLSILAMSHHHWDSANNTKIMNLSIDIGAVCTSLMQTGAPITPRLICVLQKGGVETQEDIQQYLKWSASIGVQQVCFKELYVSSSTESYYHNDAANIWSKEHQIPLALLTETLALLHFKVTARLPWGAPIYRGEIDGKIMQVAAYTEPSLFWERKNGIARSWNIMSDGKTLASLEDKLSEIKV